MALLAIETATQQLGVAVIDGERVLSSYELLAEYPHSVELPGAVTRVLQAARLRLRELDGLVVDIGPGSFTGLRIGVAFAKSLAFTTQKPLVGIPSLDVLAAQVPFHSQPVCPLLDAKRRNVYAAVYEPSHGGMPAKRGEYLLAPVEDILAQVNGPAIFLGDGCALYRDRITARCPQAQFAPPESWWPQAATLGRLGWLKFSQGQRDDPARLTPLYLYAQTCQVNLSSRPQGAPRKPVKTA